MVRIAFMYSKEQGVVTIINKYTPLNFMLPLGGEFIPCKIQRGSLPPFGPVALDLFDIRQVKGIDGLHLPQPRHLQQFD